MAWSDMAMEWHRDGKARNGRERNGVEWKWKWKWKWNGMEWTGIEWNGTEWNGMEWHGVHGMEWNELVCSKLMLDPPK